MYVHTHARARARARTYNTHARTRARARTHRAELPFRALLVTVIHAILISARTYRAIRAHPSIESGGWVLLSIHF